jgi:peptidoglycan/LPS O-acetylase OafA/YrhL
MRLDAFLFSCLLAICLQSEYAESAIALLRSTRFRIGTMLLLAGVWAAALIGSIPATGTLLQSALAPLVLGSLVYAPGSWIFGALESAPLRWMGGISYGLYLWQQFFLVAHAASSTAVAARLFFPRVAAIFTVATISYYAMERCAILGAQPFPLRLFCPAPPQTRSRKRWSLTVPYWRYS